MKTVPVTIAALASIFLCAPNVQAQAPSLDARVSINVVEQELAQVIQHLRDRSGANIVLIEGGDNKVRDLQISDVYWRDALEYAVELAGCVVEEDKSGVLLVSEPTRVAFEFVDQEITQIIDAIGKTSGANIIVGPEVTGTLSVRLRDVPWRDALEEIVKTRGYTVVEERRNILRVVDPLTLEHLDLVAGDIGLDRELSAAPIDEHAEENACGSTPVAELVEGGPHGPTRVSDVVHQHHVLVVDSA